MPQPQRDRLLRVDLDAGTTRKEPIPAEWVRDYVGGKGLGARYLYEELDANVDPLGPSNVVLFLLGPLTGLTPGESQYAVVTKSPLTGTFLDSYSGGSFPDRLAGGLADCLGILVEGQAAEPHSLVIGRDGTRLEAADNLWGADVPTTCDHYGDAAVACIGPAGEQGVRYATVATARGDHQAGRGGVGAVLGAKRLKAVVVESEPPALVTDPPAEIRALRSAAATETEGTTDWQAASETLETIDFANAVGVLSTRGWQEGQFEGATDIGIDAVGEADTEREHPEESIPGGFRIESEDGETVPRGSTFMTLGAGLGIDDFEAVLALGDRCDRLGMDVISAGNAIAWAMRASETDVLDADLSFGDAEAALGLLESIASREPELGGALADGVERAAAAFDGETLVPTVKGMALPSYDPRGAPAMALAYGTSDRGACHRRARPVEEEAFAETPWDPATCARTVIDEQDRSAVLWSLIVDDLLADLFADDLGADWLQAVGYDHDRRSLQRTGERVWTLTRLFNVREGFDRADDALPDPLTEPLAEGPNEGRALDPERYRDHLQAYYGRRGWSREGYPTRSTLERLDLRAVVDGETPVGEEPASPPDP
jgi:aldehyde:ferredoxin oxidoreductase